MKLPDLQIKVQDIFKTSDKRQLIKNAEKVLNDLEPAKLRELQNTDQSFINLKNSRKQSIIADKDNILRMKVNYKGDILEAILLPKVLRPWIIASTHKFYGHQGRDRCYNKIRATYYWSGMKNDICQAISNCKICKMESPNLGKYMNLHLEIGTVPMHFLAMDTIEIRDADSAYKYAFTLIDMLTNYMFVIPVKDICGKTLVHEYIYIKCTYLSEERRNSCQTMAQASLTNTGKFGQSLSIHTHSVQPQKSQSERSNRKCAQFPEKNNEKDQTQ